MASIYVRLQPATRELLKLGAECEVLEPPDNKPHGLREVYILDPDGYVWVVDMPSLSKWEV